jgi:hypothetical protein
VKRASVNTSAPQGVDPTSNLKQMDLPTHPRLIRKGDGYSYSPIWVMIVITFSLAAVQVFVMRLITDERLTGGLENTTAYNLLGWGTIAPAPSDVVMMLGKQSLRLPDVNLF